MLRDDCLDEHLVLSYRRVRETVEEWRIGFDLIRSHASLDGFISKPKPSHWR
ncbi:hypothetical protein [Microbaculum sp. FT89]|uniref:hypothetical protein n=1 Tax=Microbaculum sp. FT89 TaxID=3447298 RepID=UPI003F53D2D9